MPISQSRLPRHSIPLSQSVWPAVEDILVLPDGMKVEEAWKLHSMPNLLTCGDPRTSPPQIVFHRGFYFEGGGYADGATSSLLRAFEAGGNLVELDGQWTRRGFSFVQHDLAQDRQTLFQGPWKDVRRKKIKHTNMIIRDMGSGGRYLDTYVKTNDKIASTTDVIMTLLKRNPYATIFRDGRDDDGAKNIADNAKRSMFHQHVAEIIYPYSYPTGHSLVKAVEDENPPAEWLTDVRVVPTLNADQLPVLSGVDLHSTNYQAMFLGGQNWIRSMINTGANVWGVGFPVSGVGENYDPIKFKKTGVINDLNGEPITDTTTKAEFVRDAVLLSLMKWFKKEYPTIWIVGSPVSYHFKEEDQPYLFTFHTGIPLPWPKGAASHHRELRSLPGKAFELGAQLVICDRPIAHLSAVTRGRTYYWPKDVDNPMHNIITR